MQNENPNNTPQEIPPTNIQPATPAKNNETKKSSKPILITLIAILSVALIACVVAIVVLATSRQKESTPDEPNHTEAAENSTSETDEKTEAEIETKPEQEIFATNLSDLTSDEVLNKFLNTYPIGIFKPYLYILSNDFISPSTASGTTMSIKDLPNNSRAHAYYFYIIDSNDEGILHYGKKSDFTNWDLIEYPDNEQILYVYASDFKAYGQEHGFSVDETKDLSGCPGATLLDDKYVYYYFCGRGPGYADLLEYENYSQKGSQVFLYAHGYRGGEQSVNWEKDDNEYKFIFTKNGNKYDLTEIEVI